MKRLSIACLVLLAFSGLETAMASDVDATLPALRKTLDRHLAAINARDLPTLLSTVTAGNQLTLILPNGKVLGTREQYRKLHVDWFAEHDWRMVFDVQEVRLVGDVGIARVRYDSQVAGANGQYTSQRIALLTLIFAQEHGGWHLVYDQNTVVPNADAKVEANADAAR